MCLQPTTRWGAPIRAGFACARKLNAEEYSAPPNRNTVVRDDDGGDSRRQCAARWLNHRCAVCFIHTIVRHHIQSDCIRLGRARHQRKVKRPVWLRVGAKDVAWVEVFALRPVKTE